MPLPPQYTKTGTNAAGGSTAPDATKSSAPNDKPNNSIGNTATGTSTNNAQTTDNAMQTFYKNMMAPIDMNDPGVKSILQGAQSSATAGANAQGIGGPMSVAAGQNAYMGTAATMDMQRKQMALGAMGQLSGSQLGLGSLNLGYGGLGVQQGQLSMEQQAQQYEENFNNTYAPWEIAAGIGGTVLGGASKIGSL